MAEDPGSRVRAARRHDVPALVDLRIQFLGEAAHDEPRLRMLPDARKRSESALPVWMEQQGRLIFVAEGPPPEDGEAPLIGYAMGFVEVEPAIHHHQHIGEIAELYVLADARGGGIGGALVDVLATALRNRGAEVFRAAVPVSQPAAARSLERLGYEPVLIAMERPLTAD